MFLARRSMQLKIDLSDNKYLHEISEIHFGKPREERSQFLVQTKIESDCFSLGINRDWSRWKKNLSRLPLNKLTYLNTKENMNTMKRKNERKLIFLFAFYEYVLKHIPFIAL